MSRGTKKHKYSRTAFRSETLGEKMSDMKKPICRKKATGCVNVANVQKTEVKNILAVDFKSLLIQINIERSIKKRTNASDLPLRADSMIDLSHATSNAPKRANQ